MGQATSTVTCAYQAAALSGDTCSSMAATYGLPDSDFASLNPTVSCPGDLVAGQSYCVIGTVTTDAPSSTPTTVITVTTSTSNTASMTRTTVTKPPTTLATSTKTTTSAANQPTQSGLASNCNKFHLVVSGDTCSAVESQNGISAAQFSSWNPAINAGCSNLLLGYYVCVGVPGATAPTQTGPSPQMPSLASNCNKYHQVQSGDGCQAIEQGAAISDAQFRAWNPTVDAGCDNLWLGYYVCVGVPGAASAGPSPQMPNLASNCNRYYLVQSGDGCQAVERSAGISDAQFRSWNPTIDSGCDNLWLGYYVCVGV